MKILHLMAGLGPTSGVANVARRFARVQSARGDEVRLLASACKWNPVYFDFAFAMRAGRGRDLGALQLDVPGLVRRVGGEAFRQAARRRAGGELRPPTAGQCVGLEEAAGRAA